MAQGEDGEIGWSVILDTARFAIAEPGLANTLPGVGRNPAGIGCQARASLIHLFMRFVTHTPEGVG